MVLINNLEKQIPNQSKDFSVKGYYRFNTLAETYLLSSLFINPSLILECGILDPNDFFRYEYRIIYIEIKKVFEETKTILSSLVIEKLKSNPKTCLLAKEINNISNAPGGKENFSFFLKIVLDCSRRRKISTLGKELIELSNFSEVDDLIEKTEKVFLDLSSKNKNIDSNKMSISKDDSSDLDKLFSQMLSNDNSSIGLSTNFSSLDNIFNGLFPSEVTVVASRTGMGKTSFATSLMLNLVKYQQKKVLFFSLEMSRYHIFTRIMSHISNVPLSLILKKKLNQQNIDDLEKTKQILLQYNLTIFDIPNLSISDLKSISRMEYIENGIDVIFIDYIQLISSNGKNVENRHIELAYITREIKHLARELNIPIVVLSQLSRATELTEDKRPNMWNIKSSGAIEEHFDNVLLLYRKKYYVYENKDQENQNTGFYRYDKKDEEIKEKDDKKDEEIKEKDDKKDEEIKEKDSTILDSGTKAKIDHKYNHTTEITIAKQRNGSTGRILLFFKSLYSSFADYIEM